MPDLADRPRGITHDKYERLIKAAQSQATIKVAIAHPCDDVSLEGALEAARLRLIEPILVGPPERIRRTAEQASLDISGMEIVASEHSHDSAMKAVELVTAGRVEALMKGSLHTDELMAAAVSRQAGIRTARRISHCFIMDVPNHPDALIITDAAVNIAPTLDDKVDIVQNAIDLAHAMGVPEVRVAILSAMETVNSKVPSTIEAAALCKMADRGQITGALLDGPLALDNAISPEAAAIKKISSPVAGRANVLVVPNLEAGNMLAKSLSFLADADAAGIVLGTRVPIILTSRADSLLTRLASCAVALMVAAVRRQSASAAIYRRDIPMTDATIRPVLAGQKALVVGVANDQSIAYGCAKAFRTVGADVAITWLNERARPYVEPLARELDAPITGALDVSVPGQLEAIFDRIRTEWGSLDILVHSIAFAPKDDLQGGLLNCSADGFAKAMDVSCHSFIRMAKLAAPLMTNGGTMFAMSYYGANRVVANYNVMGPVKAALEAACRYLAYELGPQGIRVHAISPGPLKTRAASGLKDFELLLNEAAQKAPLGELVDIMDVGFACAYLATSLARRITGGTVYVDGGANIIA
jgi:enoyl-[acyl-carrier-protein] reductase (NADH)/phosphotransacetylase